MTSSAESLQTLLRNSTHLWRGKEAARIDTRSSGYAALDARLPGGGWPLGAVIEIAPESYGCGELRLTLPALKTWCQDGRSVAFVQPPHIPYAPALARHGLTLSSVLWVVTDRDEDSRWAAEQLLREGAAAVLLWSTAREDRALRRLQLAAEAGKACAFLYRPPAAVTRPPGASTRAAHAALIQAQPVALAGTSRKASIPASPAASAAQAPPAALARGQLPALAQASPAALAQPSPAALRIALSAADNGVNLDLVKVRGGRPGRLVLPLNRPAT